MDRLVPMFTFALAMACTPGPNNILLAASGVNFGFVRSIPAMSGIVLGFLVVLLACCAGLGVLFIAYPPLHTTLKVAGSAYMLWLAWKIANAGQPQRAEGGEGRPLTFLQAAAFQWINPKGVLAAISGVALFSRPQSAVHDALVILPVFALATVISVLVWTAFGTVVSGLLRDPRHARIFNVVMALLLVASIVPMVL